MNDIKNLKNTEADEASASNEDIKKNSTDPNQIMIPGADLIEFIRKISDGSDAAQKAGFDRIANGVEYFLICQRSYKTSMLLDMIGQLPSVHPIMRVVRKDMEETIKRLSRDDMLAGTVFIESYRTLFDQTEPNNPEHLRYLNATNYIIRFMAEASAYTQDEIFCALMNAYQAAAYVTNRSVEKKLPPFQVLFSCLPRPYEASQETLMCYTIYCDFCMQADLTPIHTGIPQTVLDQVEELFAKVTHENYPQA